MNSQEIKLALGGFVSDLGSLRVDWLHVMIFA